MSDFNLNFIRLVVIWTKITNCQATKTIQSKYSLQDNRAISVTSATTTTTGSIYECAIQCLLARLCCQASFSESDKKCRMDLTYGCSLDIKHSDRSTLLNKECPFGWKTIQRRCVSVGKKGTRKEAKHTCAMNGGRLVIADSEEKNVWLKSVARDLKKSVQIAGVRVGKKGFFWEDENGNLTPFNYTAWDSGEPGQDEDCVMTYANSRGWNDYPCSANTLYIICEQI